MSQLLIQDYLQTQGLNLPTENITMTQLATQLILQQAQQFTPQIDPEIWANFPLPNYIQIADLQKILISLDSVYSRQNPQTAALYFRQPESENWQALIQMGQQIEPILSPENPENTHHLAWRTAQSGWANLCDDVAQWLQMGELHGDFHHRAQAQYSLPVCGEDGTVWAVLHLEHTHRLPETELAEWVGWILGILPVFYPSQSNQINN